jgi:hypothetical protein
MTAGSGTEMYYILQLAEIDGNHVHYADGCWMSYKGGTACR